MKKVSLLFLGLFFFLSLKAIDIWQYEIKYLGIAVAEVEFEHYPTEHKISVRAKSSGFASVFQKMNNSYQVDYFSDYFPKIYKKKTDQKDFFENLTMSYNHDKKIATAVDSILQETRNYEINEQTRDFFSALYFLCEQDLDNGILYLDAREVLWKAGFKKIKNEKIKLDKIEHETELYEITFKKVNKKKTRRSDLLTNNLVNENNKLFFWITDDDKRIPILAKYKMKPFSVYWEMVNLNDIYAK